MNLLPFENISYKTRLSDHEVLERLYAVTEAEKLIRIGMLSSGETKLYEGQISDQTFSIRKIIKYRNSFLPRIHGVIIPGANGTTINIKMRLHIIIIIFLFFWCAGVGMAFLVFVLLSIRDGKLNPFIFVPLMMLLLVYGATVGGFNFESRKSKQNLQQLFEAEAADQFV